MNLFRQTMVTASLGLCALLALGCASGPPRSLTSQLASTDTSIQQAQQSGAEQGALIELQQAKDKRAHAQEALNDKKYDVSMRFAQQAQVDAQYASTKARAAQTMRSAAEVDRSTQTLRKEAVRNEREDEQRTDQ